MSIHIRPATVADQPTIRALIRRVSINPFNLHWPRFLIAERQGQVVGVGQVKPHRDGSRELASIAVLPSEQGRGVGTALVRALLARERGPLYLYCVAERVTFYERLGFQVVDRAHLPPVLARTYWIGNVLGGIPRLLGRPRVQVVAMRVEVG
jgi:N-acetylglutamate synthase-like GNAT family acetyltransferase